METEDQNGVLQAPLLHSSEENAYEPDGERVTNEGGIRRKEVFEEVRKQLWLAGPLALVNLLQYLLQVISVMFVGHLGELALSGASMATSFASVTGNSLMMGMSSALDTLCGQSYGAKQYRLLGIYLQRAMIVLLIVSVPLAIIWANTRNILGALGQDPEIAAEAGAYAFYMIPTLFAYALLQSLTRFLQTQNIVIPMILCSGFTTLLHALICWLMVFKSGLGVRGAALANSISYWINVILLALYVKFSPSCAKSWTGFSLEAFQNIPTFLRLAIPSAVMVCMEIWAFEFLVLLSGILPNPKLETSVLSICLNTIAMVWMVPYGLSGAVSTRVSNELGAGNSRLARLAVFVVLGMALTEGIVVGIAMILVRYLWGYAYSDVPEVVRYIASMMPILALSNFIDGLQSVLGGTARGCGWQKIGAYVNLGSYYLAGIPFGALLAFVAHMGGKGLWLGNILALALQLISYFTITLRTDWDVEAKRATDRVYETILPEQVN